MNIYDKILNHDLFADKPPVLIDVGASGDIHAIWKPIAKYSVCIGFDPDDREIKISKDSGKGFKEFFLINRILRENAGDTKFYLTKSPYCSSTLKPDITSLSDYDICDYFKVIKEVVIPAVTIGDALKETGYDYIDWFKTDSQGTDLRIYLSIPERIRSKVLIAEFEPGIMDAYQTEDKLYKIMEYFDGQDFWCDECIIKGMTRINKKNIDTKLNFIEKRYLHLFFKRCSYWAEISYLNQMKINSFEARDYLLMSIFALLKKQYGFVFEICEIAGNKFTDTIFDEVSRYALCKMKTEGYKRLPVYILKSLINRTFKLLK